MPFTKDAHLHMTPFMEKSHFQIDELLLPLSDIHSPLQVHRLRNACATVIVLKTMIFLPDRIETALWQAFPVHKNLLQGN